MNRAIDEFGQEIGLGSRRAERQSVLFMAQICRPGGPALGQVKVRNVSSTGLMAETGLPMKVGEAVEIVLRGIGPVSGTVVRRTIDRLAIKFDLPIDPRLTLQKM